MSGDAEDRVVPPDLSQVPAGPQAEPDSPSLTTEHLSEFAEWLEARLDAVDNRFDRFDRIGSRTTRQFSEDMARTRQDVTHLHERMGQLVTGNQHALKSLLQKEIRAALEQDRYALARAARRRTLWTLLVLLSTLAALGTAGLVWLGIWTLPWQ